MSQKTVEFVSQEEAHHNEYNSGFKIPFFWIVYVLMEILYLTSVVS